MPMPCGGLAECGACAVPVRRPLGHSAGTAWPAKMGRCSTWMSWNGNLPIQIPQVGRALIDISLFGPLSGQDSEVSSEAGWGMRGKHLKSGIINRMMTTNDETRPVSTTPDESGQPEPDLPLCRVRTHSRYRRNDRVRQSQTQKARLRPCLGVLDSHCPDAVMRHRRAERLGRLPRRQPEALAGRTPGHPRHGSNPVCRGHAGNRCRSLPPAAHPPGELPAVAGRSARNQRGGGPGAAGAVRAGPD